MKKALLDYETRFLQLHLLTVHVYLLYVLLVYTT